MPYTSFYQIAKRFKAIFFDSYGVLKNHNGVIPGIQKTLDIIRREGILFKVLTNDASRSPELLKAQFEEIGIRGINTSQIITSGMMAKQFLVQKITSGKIAYLGTPNAAKYIVEADLDTIAIGDVDLDHLDDISALVFLDDEGFDWNTDINTAVNLLRRKNIPAIVANSDQIYPITHNDVSIATGGIANLVETTLNRRFMHFGKPDSQMFMRAYEEILKTKPVAKRDILMVGDTLHTDILGGNMFGVKTALVLSGNTRSDNADMLIKSTGIIPDFICTSIVT